MIYKVLILFVLVTHAGISEATSPSSPSPPLSISGGATCGDKKQVYQADNCCGASSTKVPTTTVSYTPDPLNVPVLSDSQEVSCDLPVMLHMQLKITPQKYAVAFSSSLGLGELAILERVGFSGVGIATGAMLFAGASFSEFTLDRSKFDPTNISSVSRNFYIHSYFTSSETAVKFLTWWLVNLATNGLANNGVQTPGLALVFPPDEDTRIVLSGMCKTQADNLKAFLQPTPFNGVFDFAYPTASLLARPTLPLDPSVPTFNVNNAQELQNSGGILATGWTLPAEIAA